MVGAGLAGAATAWQLASRGHDVTILERTVPASHDGSSHGSARIFRYAYPDVFYTRAVIESKALWDELDRASGLDLITPAGAVDYGPERQPEHLARVLADAGVEHELLSAAEATVTLAADRLRHARALAPRRRGDRRRRLRQRDDRPGREARRPAADRLERRWRGAAGRRLPRALGSGEAIDAGNVVVSAGGWLPSLLGQLALPAGFLAGLPEITVRQEQAYHFRYRDPAALRPGPRSSTRARPSRPTACPGDGMPASPGRRWLNTTAESSSPRPPPKPALVDPANRRRVVDYVPKYLPGLDPEPYAETTCLFTNTPNEDFLIDRADGITVLSPVLGARREIRAADRAMGGRTWPPAPATSRPGSARQPPGISAS